MLACRTRAGIWVKVLGEQTPVKEDENMQKLERTRVRLEHDILMMQAEIDRFTRRRKLLRTVSVILVLAFAAELLWMLPAFTADFGYGKPDAHLWTPIRVIFMGTASAYTIGLALSEIRILKYANYSRALRNWIKERHAQIDELS